MNATSPLHHLDATQLAALVRTKQLSPVEIVRTLLDRIERVNPRIRAIVTVMADSALAAARQAESAVMRGETLGPFHGVPFTVKDCLDTAGTPTQRGSRLFAGFVPSEDATSVARLRRAGAIPIAKTNLPEFSAWWESDNHVTGYTLNPWNTRYSAGGSSGGEGAAIAAGLSPFGLGSDVAISVRGPAHWNGIAALKPTHGTIPYTGHFPPRLGRWWHVGPMARSVRDLRGALPVLAGPDGIDGYAISDAAVDEPPSPPRVGWLVSPGFGPIDPEVARTVEAAAAALERAGCAVEPVRLPILERHDWYADVASVLFVGELLPYLRRLVGDRVAELHPVAQLFVSQEAPPLAAFVDALEAVEQLRGGLSSYFARHDVLLCPTSPMPAFLPNQAEYVVAGETVPTTHAMRATCPFNLGGVPAMSVPFGFTAGGLPIGVQLVGRWFADRTILRVGEMLEAAAGIGDRHPEI